MRRLRKVAYQFLITEELDEAIVDWRRRQPDLPTKTEAVRRLLEQALGWSVWPLAKALGF
jgi:hypothetical protein